MWLDYPFLKITHVTCVALSLAGFVLRGWWMMTRPALLERPAVRVLPHVIDTTLLASAIGLAMLLRQYPFVHGWLTAKVVALAAYVVLGTLALRRGPTMRTRVAAFGAALLVFGYIVAVAVQRNPVPFATP